MKKLFQLASALGLGASSLKNPDLEIEQITYDSRAASPAKLFAALRGTKFDGHDFIGQALSQGAKAILCEEYPGREKYPDADFLFAPNSRAALAAVSHEFYDRPTDSLNMLGITGTNGKTTTTYLIKSIFESLGESCAIIGTTGIFAGDMKIEATHTTPESLELAAALAEIKRLGARNVAMEVSSHSLAQSRVGSIKFRAAFFSNLTHEHLDYHKTMDEYAAAKRILFDRLSADAVAFVNSDDEYAGRMINGTKAHRALKVGRGDDADIQITDEKFTLATTEFSLRLNFINNDVHRFSTTLLGRFNVDNAAMALSYFIERGESLPKLIEAMKLATGAPGRMQRVSLPNGAVAAVDYAHTPDALEKAIRAARGLLEASGAGKLICVFGCGGDRDATKRPEMGEISSRLADLTIITSDNPRTEDPDEIIRQIAAGVPGELRGKTIKLADRHEAIKRAYGLSGKGDFILLAGKGHENYQIIGAEKIHFDDFEELSNL